MSYSRRPVFRWAFIIGIALVAMLVSLIWRSGFFESPSAEEKPLLIQGMALHAAICRYESDHGQLPGKLTNLVPKYIKQADLNAPQPHQGGTMFQLVRPERPTAERRMNDDLLLSIPFTSPGKAGERQIYVQEDGDVGVLKAASTHQ